MFNNIYNCDWSNSYKASVTRDDFYGISEQAEITENIVSLFFFLFFPLASRCLALSRQGAFHLGLAVFLRISTISLSSKTISVPYSRPNSRRSNIPTTYVLRIPPSSQRLKEKDKRDVHGTTSINEKHAANEYIKPFEIL